MATRSDWLVGVTLNTWEMYTSDIVIDGQLVVHRRIFLDKDLDGTAASPAFVFGDGDTGFFESSDDNLNVTLDGTSRFRYTGNLFRAFVSPGPAMNNTIAGSTTPVFLPRENDTNTGLGSAGADKGSLIAGGNEKYRFTTDGGSITAVVYQGAVVTNEDEIVFT